MIPKVIPPLTGLSVLVTRPAPQAAVLASNIAALGGEAVVLPAIQIEPIAAAVAGSHDLVIFASVNAVDHGARLINRTSAMRIAAIGKATAAALAAAQLTPDIVPATGFDSEALLAHPDLNLAPGSRVLIVRGSGGREILQETFTGLGCSVEMLDVYRRALPAIDAAFLAGLETNWAAGGINIVTATSVETLNNLTALLSERGRELLKNTPLVVASRRIRQAAIDMGLCVDCIVAAGADDQSMIGALSQWHARARTH